MSKDEQKVQNEIRKAFDAAMSTIMPTELTPKTILQPVTIKVVAAGVEVDPALKKK